jgi:hypothetical protein
LDDHFFTDRVDTFQNGCYSELTYLTASPDHSRYHLNEDCPGAGAEIVSIKHYLDLPADLNSDLHGVADEAVDQTNIAQPNTKTFFPPRPETTKNAYDFEKIARTR